MTVRIRAADPEDADGIARVFLESAEYHARLDPERYSVPEFKTISKRYREARRRLTAASGDSVTLVAELSAGIVGFVDVRLEHSPDPMHRRILYCHIVEIAVAERYRRQGIGEQLLRGAEEWGRQHGADLASLEYLVSNTRAARFYTEHMGYSAAATIAIKRL